MPATTIDNNATSFDALVADIDAANAESAAGTYVIDVNGASGPIALTGALPQIKLQAGVTLDLIGVHGAALDGQSAEPGLYVYSGTVSISDLTIQNAVAQGQAGTRYYGGGGGGHAGLGGGLFVGNQAAVTLDQVSFKTDAAIGGNGGAGVTYASATSAGTRPGRGGNSGFHYQSGFATNGHPGQAGSFGQGGGGGGGGIGGFDLGLSRAGHGGAGGAGGFGGGAGAAGHQGIASKNTYSSTKHSYHHTFITYTANGAPKKTRITTTTHKTHTYVQRGTPGKGGAGGGGLGAGGDVYVQGGGRLKVLGGSLSGTAEGGSGGNSGAGLGGSIFLQGTETLHLDPGASQTLTVDGSIADQAGYDSKDSADTDTVVIGDGTGGGTVALDAANTYRGDTILEGGTVIAGNAQAFGKGTIQAVDSTIEYAASGTYANRIELDVGTPVSGDATVFVVDRGITATLAGAITTGTGTDNNGLNALGQPIDAGQPIAVRGPGRSSSPPPTVPTPAARRSTPARRWSSPRPTPCRTASSPRGRRARVPSPSAARRAGLRRWSSTRRRSRPPGALSAPSWRLSAPTTNSTFGDSPMLGRSPLRRWP